MQFLSWWCGAIFPHLFSFTPVCSTYLILGPRSGLLVVEITPVKRHRIDELLLGVEIAFLMLCHRLALLLKVICQFADVNLESLDVGCGLVVDCSSVRDTSVSLALPTTSTFGDDLVVDPAGLAVAGAHVARCIYVEVRM